MTTREKRVTRAAARGARQGRSRLSAWLGAAAIPACAACAVCADSVKTMDAVLRERFPDAQIRRDSVYLSDEQARRIEAALGAALPSAVVRLYRVTRGADRVATVFFDVHRVRSDSQTLMLAVAPDGRLADIEVLAFREPPQHRPQRDWYAALVGRRLSRTLRVGRDVEAATGATLTSRATVEAVRRALATHNEIFGEGADEPERRREPPHDGAAPACNHGEMQ